jgi:hypothetical protein
MKRIGSVLMGILFFVMLSSSAIAADSILSSKQSSNNEIAAISIETTERVIQEENAYQISEIVDNADGKVINLLVRVYDCDRKVIYERKFLPTFRGRPSVSMWDDNTVKVTLNVGTGLNYTQFCDRKNSVVSPVYITPLLVGNGKVVVPKQGKLVVSDMFDQNIYYKEIILEDFADVANPVDAFREVKWEDAEKLRITYLTGNTRTGFVEKTEIVDLSAL